MRAPRLRHLFAAIAILTACGSDATSTQPVCADSVDTIVVSAGTTPTFSWSPACRTRSLRVLRVSDQQNMWLIQGETQSIRSGVRYGQTISGVTVLTAPTPLVAGTQYRVVISHNAALISGAASFTP